MRKAAFSTAVLLSLDCLPKDFCYSSDVVQPKPFPINHPDLGILHVNSLVHPDVGNIHRDQSVYHHNEQDYYYDDLILDSRSFNTNNLNRPGISSNKTWLQQHRVDQPDESVMRDSGWIESHKIESPSLSKDEAVMPQSQQYKSRQSQLTQASNEVHDGRTTIIQVPTDAQKPHNDVKQNAKSGIAQWISKHLILKDTPEPSVFGDSKLFSSTVESQGALQDITFTDSSIQHDDRQTTPGATIKVMEWILNHRVETTPLPAIDQDALLSKQDTAMGDLEIIKRVDGVADTSMEDEAQERFGQYKQVDADILDMPPPITKPPHLFTDRTPDNLNLPASEDQDMESLFYTDVTTNSITNPNELNIALPVEESYHSMEKSAETHEALEKINNAVLAGMNDPAETAEALDGEDTNYYIDDDNIDINTQLEKILSEKEHEADKEKLLLEQTGALQPFNHQTIDSIDEDKLLSENKHLTDELAKLNNYILDTKDKLNHIETFDENAVVKANAGDSVLESELTELSQDLQKTEEELADVSAQAKASDHHKVVDTDRELAVNEEIEQMSDSINQLEEAVEQIRDSERNSAKNVQAAEDRAEHVMEAKLDKIGTVLETNSNQIEKLETEIINEKQYLNHEMAEEHSEKDDKLSKDLESHELAANQDVKTVEDMAAKVDNGLKLLKSEITQLNAKQNENQAVVSKTLEEMANNLLESKESHQKALNAIASAQESLSERIKSSVEKEHKPVVLVLPEQVTDSAQHLIDLEQTKDVLNEMDAKTENLKEVEAVLRNSAIQHINGLTSLKHQTDQSVNALMKGAEIMNSQTQDEEKHDKEEDKDEKLIQELKEHAGISDADSGDIHRHEGGWSDWSKWSFCYGFGCKTVGKAQRYRVCKSHNGWCEGSYWQSKSCRRSCDLASADSNWSEWNDWSPCSQPCGPGTSQRERECQKEPCIGDSHENEPCNLGECFPYALGQSYNRNQGLSMILQEDEHPIVGLPSNHHAITCEDQPCMNGGKCIPMGHSEKVNSRFVYFQCDCVHPYKGLMCDTTCDTDSRVNGIVIGVLAGVIGLMLLCIIWSASYEWRRRLKLWKKCKADSNYGRKRGCWETIFGCKPKCTCKRVNSSTTCSSTCSYCGSCSVCSKISDRCSRCSSGCGSLSVNDYMYKPPHYSPMDGMMHTDMVKRNHKSLKSLLDADDTQYKVGMMPVPMHGTSGMYDTLKPWSPHDKTSIKDSKSKSSTKKVSSKSKTESSTRNGTGISTSNSATTGETSGSGSDSDSDSNENDNARDHQSTLQSVTTSMQNRTNNQKCDTEQDFTDSIKPVTVAASVFSKKHGKSSGRCKKGCVRRVGHLSKKFKKFQRKKPDLPQIAELREESELMQPAASPPITILCKTQQSPDILLAERVEQNLTEFIDSCDKMDTIPSYMPSQFRDTELANRIQSVRRKYAASQYIATEQKEREDNSTDDQHYSLVNKYMQEWREAGRTPLAILNSRDKPEADSQVVSDNREKSEYHTAEVIFQEKPAYKQALQTTDVRDWEPILDNPVHAVWTEIASPASPRNRHTNLSSSLASAVESVRSFVSKHDKHKTEASSNLV